MCFWGSCSISRIFKKLSVVKGKLALYYFPSLGQTKQNNIWWIFFAIFKSLQNQEKVKIVYLIHLNSVEQSLVFLLFVSWKKTGRSTKCLGKPKGLLWPISKTKTNQNNLHVLLNLKLIMMIMTKSFKNIRIFCTELIAHKPLRYFYIPTWSSEANNEYKSFRDLLDLKSLTLLLSWRHITVVMTTMCLLLLFAITF